MRPFLVLLAVLVISTVTGAALGAFASDLFIPNDDAPWSQS